MKTLLAAALFLLLAVPAAAQRDCGDGLPCGKLPWDLPLLPVLSSPTPMPTVNATVVAQPTQVSGAVPTAPALPTSPPLNEVDTSGIGDSMATLNAVMQSTPLPVHDVNGTPVDTGAVFNDLGGNAGEFFGYAKGVSSVSLGVFSPLVAFSLLAMATLISFKMLTFFLPVFSAVFGVARKIVQVILDFLPF